MPARAQILDTLLPAGIPGYGTPFGVTLPHDSRRADTATGWNFGDITWSPSLALSTGYDSAPNGGPASPLLCATPALQFSDLAAGLGAYASAAATRYPTSTGANTATTTLAAGFSGPPGPNTPVLGAGYVAGAQSAYSFTTAARSQPLKFSVAQARAADGWNTGLVTLTPELSAAQFWFPTLPQENRTDVRESLTASYAPGGPLTAITAVHITESDARTTRLNNSTAEALAGLSDMADGLWTVRGLAGFASRRSRAGRALNTPVLELSLDWLPTRLTQVRLTAAREVDDPDQIEAAPYTVTQAKLELHQAYLRSVTIDGSASFGAANFAASRLREFLAGTEVSVTDALDAHLSVSASYVFNDRQANLLRAANEHVVTVGLTWRP
jgi:hypothetical protein